MSRPQLITLVGEPGAACEGDACLPRSAAEADGSGADPQPAAREGGDTAAGNTG